MKRRFEEIAPTLSDFVPNKRYKTNFFWDPEQAREDEEDYTKISNEESILDPIEDILWNSEDTQQIRDALSKLSDLNVKFIDCSEEDSYTPLMILIERDLTEIAKELIPKVDLAVEDEMQQHALHYACENNNEEIAMMIIDMKKDDKDFLDRRDLDQMTPILIAAKNGNKNICEKLLSLDVDTRIVFNLDTDTFETYLNRETNEDQAISAYEDDCQPSENHSAQYYAALSGDIETYKIFDASSGYYDPTRPNEDENSKWLKTMCCVILEPELVPVINYCKRDANIPVAHITSNGVQGPTSAEPSLEEGSHPLAAAINHDLLEQLCVDNFGDNVADHWDLWKYAYGEKPILLHAVDADDMAMLEYLLSTYSEEEIQQQSSEITTTTKLLTAAGDNMNLDMVKILVEKLNVIKTLEREKIVYQIRSSAPMKIIRYLLDHGARAIDSSPVLDLMSIFGNGKKWADENEDEYETTFCTDPELGQIEVENNDDTCHIMTLNDDTLAEILLFVHIQTFAAVNATCTKFHQLLSKSVWQMKWKSMFNLAVLNDDEPVAWPFLPLKVAELWNSSMVNNYEMKIANVCGFKGKYCYKIKSLTGDSTEVTMLHDFEKDPFIMCKVDQTINFGDIEPINAPEGFKQIYNAEKIKEFIPSGQISFKLVREHEEGYDEYDENDNNYYM